MNNSRLFMIIREYVNAKNMPTLPATDILSLPVHLCPLFLFIAIRIVKKIEKILEVFGF